MIDEPQQAAAGDPARTGVPAVDAVLETVESLGGRPLEEHASVFESAHDQLRRALDAAPEQS